MEETDCRVPATIANAPQLAGVPFRSGSEFHQANRWNMNRIASCRCIIERHRRRDGKSRVPGEIPDNSMRVHAKRGHQMSVLGKSFHISQRASSISSADSEIPRSAQSPLMLSNGLFVVFSLHKRVACARSSSCLSRGSRRTASRIACSTDTPFPLSPGGRPPKNHEDRPFCFRNTKVLECSGPSER